MNFDTYKLMLGYDGITARDRAVNNLKRDINALAATSPAYKDVLVDGKKRTLMISSSLDPHIKKFQALPGEDMFVGNLIRYANHDYWVTACSVDDGMYAYGEMVLCNEVVRFISPYDNKTILEYPTLITNTTKFNTGETPNKRLTLVSGQFAMLLPINEHTLRIDNDFRFLLDKRADYPSAYRVTYVDPVTYGYDLGLLNVVLLQCQFNPDTDSVNLMIADYYKHDLQEAFHGEISLDTVDAYVKIGFSKTFAPVLRGEVATPLQFTVDMMEELLPYVRYTVTDESITFEVDDDMRLIGNYIKLTIADKYGQRAQSTLVKIRGVI